MLALVLVFIPEIAMAKPPEPLEEILPKTSLIIDAVVVEVKAEGPDLDRDSPDVPRQVVVLSVNRVVRGTLSPEEQKSLKIVVTKPKAPYKLRVGVKGPWLLEMNASSGERIILGRYGPDSWSFEKIEAKLKDLALPQLR